MSRTAATARLRRGLTLMLMTALGAVILLSLSVVVSSNGNIRVNVPWLVASGTLFFASLALFLRNLWASAHAWSVRSSSKRGDEASST